MDNLGLVCDHIPITRQVARATPRPPLNAAMTRQLPGDLPTKDLLLVFNSRGDPVGLSQALPDPFGTLATLGAMSATLSVES